MVYSEYNTFLYIHLLVHLSVFVLAVVIDSKISPRVLSPVGGRPTFTLNFVIYKNTRAGFSLFFRDRKELSTKFNINEYVQQYIACCNAVTGSRR